MVCSLNGRTQAKKDFTQGFFRLLIFVGNLFPAESVDRERLVHNMRSVPNATFTVKLILGIQKSIAPMDRTECFAGSTPEDSMSTIIIRILYHELRNAKIQVLGSQNYFLKVFLLNRPEIFAFRNSR